MTTIGLFLLIHLTKIYVLTLLYELPFKILELCLKILLDVGLKICKRTSWHCKTSYKIRCTTTYNSDIDRWWGGVFYLQTFGWFKQVMSRAPSLSHDHHVTTTCQTHTFHVLNLLLVCCIYLEPLSYQSRKLQTTPLIPVLVVVLSLYTS